MIAKKQQIQSLQSPYQVFAYGLFILSMFCILLLSSCSQGISGLAPVNSPSSAASSQSQPIVLSKSPIKIGAVLSLSGFASNYGVNSRRGLELAASDINAKGGINGRPIEVIFEDDRTDAKTAASAASKLINIDQVVALIGGTWDLSLEPMVPIADQSGLIIINPSTGNTDPSGRLSDNLYRTWPSIRSQMDGLSDTFEKDGIKTVAVFRNSGSWALAHRDSLRSVLERHDAKIIADFAGVEIDNNDFKTEIAKLRELKPDAIFLATGSVDAANIFRQIKAQGIDVKIFSSDGALGESIRQNVVNPKDANGVYFIGLYPRDPEFDESFQRAFNASPGVSSDTAYLAMKLLAHAMESTNSTKTSDLVAFLDQSGRFDQNGDLISQIPLYQVLDGKPVLVQG